MKTTAERIKEAEKRDVEYQELWNILKDTPIDDLKKDAYKKFKTFFAKWGL